MGVIERRQRERQERVERILKAALKVFAKKGFSDASMNEIAEEAELGKATIYYYFPSKEKLFFSLLKEETRKFYQQAYERVRAVEDLHEFVARLMYFHLEYFQHRPELLSLFFPIGKSSPVFLKGDESFEKEAALSRKPLEEKMKSLVENSGLASEISQIMELIWTFLIGSSVKLAQGYPVEKVKKGVETFLFFFKSCTGRIK